MTAGARSWRVVAESELLNLALTKLQSYFDFDEYIKRREVPALKVHPMVLGYQGGELFAASVADMGFRAPGVVTDSLQKRLDQGVFGYETVESALGQLAKAEEKP